MKLQEFVQSSSLSDEELIIEIHKKNIPLQKHIQTIKIKQYLIMVDKWLNIKTNSEIVVDSLDSFDTFQVQEPMIMAKLIEMLDQLVLGGLLSENDKTYILSLGNAYQSLVEEAGYGIMEMSHLKELRGNT